MHTLKHLFVYALSVFLPGLSHAAMLSPSVLKLSIQQPTALPALMQVLETRKDRIVSLQVRPRHTHTGVMEMERSGCHWGEERREDKKMLNGSGVLCSGETGTHCHRIDG